jgi:predicted GIY-YIG superfamily endonuclease
MVYILHFDKKLSHAQHYVGYSPSQDTLERRIEEHKKGKSRARIMEVLFERGISFTLAAVLEGERDLERKIKKSKHTARYCPICQAEKEAKKAK